MPAPRLLTAQFYDLGAGVTIIFDEGTNLAGLSGVWNCELLFNNTAYFLGIKPTCAWIDAATISMTFGARATVVPGEMLFLLNKRLQSTWPRARLYAHGQNATILNANDPITPSVGITAPASIGLCDDLAMDSGLTSGSGGRAFSYNWTVVSAAGDGATKLQNVTQAVSAATLSQAPVLFIARSALPEKTKITFALTVVNFLGMVASETLTVSKGSAPSPLVYIQGDSPKRTTRSVEMKLQLSAWQPQLCQGVTLTSSTMLFSWVELTGRFQTSGGSFATVNPRTLTIPENLLTPLEEYEFLAIVKMDGSPHINNTARVVVVVEQQPLIAAIGGGATRVVGADAWLTLDASPSYDPDESNSTWHFAWSCLNVTEQPPSPCVEQRTLTLSLFTHVTARFCPCYRCVNASGRLLSLLIEAVDNVSLVLPPGSLAVDDGYHFSVLVMKDSRNASATSNIRIQAGAPPIVNIQALTMAKYNPNEGA